MAPHYPLEVDKRGRDPRLQCLSSAVPGCSKSDCLELSSVWRAWSRSSQAAWVSCSGPECSESTLLRGRSRQPLPLFVRLTVRYWDSVSDDGPTYRDIDRALSPARHHCHRRRAWSLAGVMLNRDVDALSLFALGMELGVTPTFLMWQARVAARRRRAERTPRQA